MLPAPGAKLTGLPQSNSGSGFAQHVCRHSTTRVEVMPQGYTHHAREVCAKCGRFVRWLPRPETIERARLNAFRLARLAMRPDLTGWERQFIRSVGEKKHLSPRQEALIARLVENYLSEGNTK
jgi:hypothetical protein